MIRTPRYLLLDLYYTKTFTRNLTQRVKEITSKFVSNKENKEEFYQSKKRIKGITEVCLQECRFRAVCRLLRVIRINECLNI